MNSLKVVIGGICACLISSAQVPDGSPASGGSSGSGGPSHGRVPGAAVCDCHSNARRRQFRCAR